MESSIPSSDNLLAAGVVGLQEEQNTIGRLTPWVAYATFVVCSFSSLQFGYNTGVMTAPSNYIEDFLNSSYTRYGTISDTGLTWLYALTVSLYTVGGAFGALAAAPMGDILGRKGALLLNNVFSISAGLMMGFCDYADNFELLIMGRIIIGFYAGVAITIVPLFLAEISPKSIRGAVGVNHQLAITVGILIAQVLGLYVLDDEDNWYILLSLTGVLGAIEIFLLPFCPESPRWLLIIDRNETAAKQALAKYTGTSDVTAALTEMKIENLEESKEPKVGVKGLFTNPNYRMPLLISVVSHAGQQLSGVNAIFFYATEIYEMIWPNNPSAVEYATVGTGAINVFMTIVSVFIIEKTGRRKLLIFPYIGTVIFCGIITLSLSLTDPNEQDAWTFISLACVYGYVICFAIGPGPIPYILVAEIWSQGPRPAAMSLSIQVNWWCNFVVGLTFPVLQESIGEFTFLIYMCFLFCTVVFTFFFVPETKNKTFEEIVSNFRKDPKQPEEVMLALTNQ
ncbi:solute carrier family 2, facilitated glucose transporter member 1-like [Saccoglossus kowalevskii]|uniref:Solute carrier family 2, facilitated glucose transporter member 1-like n=1 Tax=Saccoglossus kowalevskii TaxID=10224 RepID=A0ABM0MIR5_SACKO|nr:PREDICTED: solute carrier family 2, facilitated glucose transporter member 1-like [Saccoglossus kowalevskii]